MGGGGMTEGFNIGFNVEVVKPLLFNRKAEKIEGFIIVYRLYLRIKMREVTVEKQIQWILSYVQRKLENIWKENLLEDLELGKVEFKLVGKFLTELKEEVGRGDEELVKVAELRRIEQEGRTKGEFLQKF